MLFKSVINFVLWAKQFYTKVFCYLCDNTVNGTQYHKNTKRNATKIPNEMPQKHQMIYHKNTKRNATKTPNEMRNPQEISNFG